MALSSNDQASIRNYLLGQLSDDEQQKTEERLMLDDDLFEELETLKGELVEEYRAGGLRENEREWFERHFLASSEGKKMYTFAVALNCLQQPAPQRETWFEQLRALFNKKTWTFAVATATAALIVIAVTVFISRPQPQTHVAVVLTNSAGQRGPGDVQVPRVTVSPNTGEVRASLTLPGSVAPGANYRAELDDGRNTKPVKLSQEGNSVVAVIPAAELPRGYYALRLFVIGADGKEQQIPGDYRFIVE
jgi:methionine-rich copper-binding protein CopC